MSMKARGETQLLITAHFLWYFMSLYLGINTCVSENFSKLLSWLYCVKSSDYVLLWFVSVLILATVTSNCLGQACF